MAEFVKERARVIPGQERRFALGGSGEVADVHHDRPLLSAQPALFAHRRTPGARPLGGPREPVAEEDGDVAAVPRDLPRPHVGMVERQVERAELQREESVRGVEGRADHRLESEIGLERGLVEVVFGAPAPLGIIAPVPGFEIAVDAVPVHHPRQHRGIGQRLRPRGLPDPHQQVADMGGRLRHLGLELEGGEALVAEQPRPLLAELEDFRRDGAVVGGPAAGAPRHPGPVGLLAQVAAGRELEEGHDDRAVQRQRMAIHPAFLRRGAGRRHDEAGQAGEVGRVEGHHPVALVGQQVLRKSGGQDRKPLLHRGHPLAPRLVQRGAGTDEHPLVKLQHPGLFRRETEPVAALPERLDPREEARVHRHFRRIGREFRRQIPLQRLPRGGRVGTGEVPEHAPHPGQRLLRQFQRLDRVGEAGRLGVGGDRRDMSPCLGECRLEGGGEVLVPDPGEGRQGEGAGEGGEQRIGHGGLLWPTS